MVKLRAETNTVLFARESVEKHWNFGRTGGAFRLAHHVHAAESMDHSHAAAIRVVRKGAAFSQLK